MSNLKPGDTVALNTDVWSDVGLTAKVVNVTENKVVVLDEDGVTRTLSSNQVIKQSFLAE